MHAILILPIKLNNRVIGTVNLSRREAGKPFRENDIYIASQLTQMVALILDNSQVYTRLQHELSERKQVEEALRISQEDFMGYFNMGAVGVCVTSPEKEWIEVNDRLCQMLDYPLDELKQHTWEELTHPDDVQADLTLFDRVLRGEIDSYHLDKRFIRRDGGILHTSIYVSCQRYSNGLVRYILASLVDITERIEQEEALHQAQKQLMEQQQAVAVINERQRMARDLHDSVNQSIHSLVLLAETLVIMLGKNNVERAMQISERLQESARQALKETRLLLYQTQSTTKGRDINLVEELNIRLESVERRAGVKAQIALDGSMDYCPEAWHENLFWLTMEALNNSLKHAQARNVDIFIRCSPSRLELEIVDDGRGFDTNRPNAGGYGLRNMQKRAELLGGSLSIHSHLASGTQVLFCVDIKE